MLHLLDCNATACRPLILLFLIFLDLGGWLGCFGLVYIPFQSERASRQTGIFSCLLISSLLTIYHFLFRLSLTICLALLLLPFDCVSS
jgi:hypothetical protein